MIEWSYYPRSRGPSKCGHDLIRVLQTNSNTIDSGKHPMKSNLVLERLRIDLEKIGFEVEKSKRKKDKISVPALYGRNGVPEKTFDLDAYNADSKFCFEVEAGGGVQNHLYLKDIFMACLLPDVDELAMAVPNKYKIKQEGKEVITKPFQNVERALDAVYASTRLVLPLKGVLLIGY